MLFNIFSSTPAGPPPGAPATPAHPTHSATVSHVATSRLLAFHCFLCDHRSCVQNVNSSVSSSLSPLARQSPAGLWCGGARPDPLYCVGSSRCPLVLRFEWRLVCTATLAAWALVAAVPPAVVVAAVVVATAAPAAEAAVGAVAVATPCNGHMRYLGHRDIHTLLPLRWEPHTLMTLFQLPNPTCPNLLEWNEVVGLAIYLVTYPHRGNSARSALAGQGGAAEAAARFALLCQWVLPTYYDCHRAPALWPLL
jgi:hypothetical protein